MEIVKGQVVLCRFYFTDLKMSKNRPELVFKDNLPYDDFIAMPISSKVEKLHKDEELIGDDDFEEGGLPVLSKLMIRKTFVVSKKSIVKSYGLVNKTPLKKYHKNFCHYFSC